MGTNYRLRPTVIAKLSRSRKPYTNQGTNFVNIHSQVHVIGISECPICAISRRLNNTVCYVYLYGRLWEYFGKQSEGRRFSQRRVKSQPSTSMYKPNIDSSHTHTNIDRSDKISRFTYISAAVDS